MPTTAPNILLSLWRALTNDRATLAEYRRAYTLAEPCAARCACGAPALITDNGVGYCAIHRPPLRTLGQHTRAVLANGGE